MTIFQASVSLKEMLVSHVPFEIIFAREGYTVASSRKWAWNLIAVPVVYPDMFSHV